MSERFRVPTRQRAETYESTFRSRLVLFLIKVPNDNAGFYSRNVTTVLWVYCVLDF